MKYVKIKYIFNVLIVLFLIGFSNQAITAQYRDPFTSKKKTFRVKKNNSKGLFSLGNKTNNYAIKHKNPFDALKFPKGTVGLSVDPFFYGNKSSYKPSGIDKDSFSYSQRKRAIRDKYDKSKVKKAAQKSREQHFKLQYKYGWYRHGYCN